MLETMTTERGESIQDVDSLAQRLQQLDDNSQVTPAGQLVIEGVKRVREMQTHRIVDVRCVAIESAIRYR